ncbi:hypothetical protein [Paenibacillus residui]|uniref:Uncharacterized protein n=1 Tax=Paenibacillus residui TaxID=629724 RepID=A0ABW3D8M0_9BACL
MESFIGENVHDIRRFIVHLCTAKKLKEVAASILEIFFILNKK